MDSVDTLFPPSALQQRLLDLVTSWPVDCSLGVDAPLAYRNKEVALLRGDLDAQRSLLSEDFDLPVAGSGPEALAARFADSPTLWLVAQWMRWMWRRNQFAVVDDLAVRALVEEASVLFSSRGEVIAMASHRRRLSILLADILGPYQSVVTSARYPAELIVRALGLDDSSLLGPLLDIGCGDASLVRYVRSRGVAAAGIDRDASAPGQSVDWLSFDYGSSRWQTIISHHAFSLFFHNADRSGDVRAQDYARAYMRIVNSLRDGGTFAYYPVLPFVESHLSSTFVVTHVDLPSDLCAAAVAVDVPLSTKSCHVRRRA
jgi:hypothetical protein